MYQDIALSAPQEHSLCYSKCGPWTSSNGITWELARNTESLAPPENC